MADKAVSTSNSQALKQILASIDSQKIPSVVKQFEKQVKTKIKQTKEDINLNKIFKIKRVNYSIIAKLSDPTGPKGQVVYIATILGYAEGNCPFPIGETFPISEGTLKLTGRVSSSLDFK